MTDQWVRRPDADLAYDESGTGPTIGYSHGILVSRASEAALGLIDWAPLADHRRLVRYDARGHGESTGRPVPEDYTWRYLAGDLVAVIDQVHGQQPVDWIGASMGCGTLLWAATAAPQRFHRLVLEIPPTTGPTRVAQAGWYRDSADLIERDGAATWIAGMRAVDPPPIFADLPGFGITVDIAEPLLPSALRGAALSDLPATEQLARLSHPTLILSWDTDPVHPVSTAEYLAGTLPDARLHVSKTVDDIRTWPERIGAFLDQ